MFRLILRCSNVGVNANTCSTMKACRPLFFQQTYKSFKWNSSSNWQPGIQRRLRLISEDVPDLSTLKIDEQAIDDLESDVSRSDILRAKHSREVDNIRKTVKFKQIERRYFGVNKKPNMLTWSEKEQIRQLNNSEPEIWTPEKLADSFPATVDVIKKLLRTQWKPRDANRIKKHDKAVSTNWRAFEMGRLNLPEPLSDHFKKFTSRNKIIINKDAAKTELMEITTPAGGEWTGLITKCRNHSNGIRKHEQCINHVSTRHQPSETYVISSSRNRMFRDKKLITLSQLKNVTELTRSEVSKIDKAFIQLAKNSENKPKEIGIINPRDYAPSATHIHSENVVFNCSKHEDQPVPLTIAIPKAKWKKGGVYRVNNCYYSDDGKFLYKAVHWSSAEINQKLK